MPIRREAVLAFDHDNAPLFTIAVVDGKLELTLADKAAAIEKAARRTERLVFLDPDNKDQAALWVWPVLRGSLDVESKAGGKRIEIEGKQRSFVPTQEVFGWRGFVAFSLRIFAHTGADAIIDFDKLAIGPAQLSDRIPCNRKSLEDRTISRDTPGVPPSPPTYLTLLGLQFDDAHAPWPFSARFTSYDTLLKDRPQSDTDVKPHAVLALQLVARLPLKREPVFHDFAAFGLLISGAHLPTILGQTVGGTPTVYAWTEVTQRLPAEPQWTTSGRTAHWMVSFTVPQQSAAATWNNAVTAPVVDAAHMVQDGRPFTTLPALANPSATPTRPLWQAMFSFLDRHDDPIAGDEDDAKLQDKDFVAGLPGDAAAREHLVTIVPRRLTPIESTGQRVDVQFPSMATLGSPPLAVNAVVLPVALEIEHPAGATTRHGFVFRLKHLRATTASSDPKDAPTVRMGALDLRFPAAGMSGELQEIKGFAWEPGDNLLTALWAASVSPQGFAAERIAFRSTKYTLAVSGIAPGGQDDLPGDEFLEDPTVDEESTDAATPAAGRRESALVISLDQPSGDGASAVYQVALREVIQKGESQTIRATLTMHDTTLAAGSNRALVIDPHPFSVAVVEAPALVPADASTATEVANWTNRQSVGGGWEVSSTAEGFDLFLPPQGIGEAMHKRIDAHDIEPGQPVDFRFTPITRLALRASVERQRFTEPAWNLRRIMGTPAVRQPGAPVRRVDFELFYGVFGHTEPDDVLVTEIGARLGNHPGIQPSRPAWAASQGEQATYRIVSAQWSDVHRALLGRLAVFEPHSPSRPDFVFGADDHTQFELRETAKLRYPLAGAPPPEIKSLFTTDPNDPEYPGLAGGWSWGFESRNILTAVGRVPRSTAGSLARFYLSAAGGWGHQKATFDNNRTTIDAQVELGRVTTLKIERIGRINVVWNRAKHVIVYERTVAATRQFFQEQHRFVGNPILRKVDEYVELLEEERPFPDTAVPKATRGALLACRFECGTPPRIRVNSRWGEDIGTTGWKIPLWLRGATPPDVYPKPDVKMLFAGHTVSANVAIALYDPEKLYFYTNTDPALDENTNKWPSIEHVDCQATDQLQMAPPKASGTGDPDHFGVPKKKPEDPDDWLIRPGTGAFTFTLAPAPAAVNVMADRVDQVIQAVPRSLTLMRGVLISPTPLPTSDSAVGALHELRDHISNAFAPVLHHDGAQPIAAQLATFKTEFTRVTEAVAKATGELPQDATALCQRLTERVDAQFGVFQNQIKLEAVAALHRLEEDARAAFAHALDGATDVEALKESLVEALSSLVESTDGARAAVRSVRSSVGEAVDKLDDLKDALRELGTNINLACAEAVADLLEIDEWDGADEATKAKLVAEARVVIAALVQAVEPYLQPSAVDYAITEVVREWVGDMLDAVRHRLVTRRADANNAITLILATLGTKSRDETVDAIDAFAAQAFDDVLALVEAVETDWEEKLAAMLDTPLEGPLDAWTTRIRGVIEGLTTIPTPAALLAAFDRRSTEALGSLDLAIDEALAAARAQARKTSQALCQALLPPIADIVQALTRLLKPEALDFIADLANSLSADQLRAEIERVYGVMAQAAGEFFNRAKITLPLPAVNLPLPDTTFRLLRGFGDVPRLPQLGFKIPQIGYYFFDFPQNATLPVLLPRVNLTPVTAFANQLGRNLLNAIEIKVPSTSLFDRLVPADLRDFNLSKVFPNIGGLKLDGLFRGLRLPNAANEGVRVTHGVNEAERSGWLQVDVDVPIVDSTTVFEIAGVTLTVGNARFAATSRIDAAAGQAPRQQAHGSVTGDCNVTVGSFALVELHRCTVHFDEGGHIRFDISPSQVQLKPPLDFLSRILEPFSSSKNGFSVAVTPSGVRTSLVLPLPNIQAGSFGIANLSVGFVFELLVPEFTIRTAIQLARRDRPFTLTIFVLGGAGWFNLAVSYTPRTGVFRTDVNIAIYASASLAISLGPVEGGVYVYVGVTVDYQAFSTGGSSLNVGLRILFVGEVSLFGFISVGLTLGLEATYGDGNELVGRGFLNLSVKIGWFLTINVSMSVQYSFGKGTSSSSSSSQIESAADSYVDMF